MIALKTMTFPSWMGNPYLYSSYNLDMRKYFNPWLRHVIALQATTSYRTGDVPFYELAMMGGEDQMRGYYKGALRDKVLVDGQLEYRMPVWKMFGVTTWVGTGRVADSYSDLSFDGFWLSYGAGLRVRVDTKHNTNLRLDWGFGPNGVNGFYINFAEAF
jgi:outer membrane protein assembly factor BamA